MERFLEELKQAITENPEWLACATKNSVPRKAFTVLEVAAILGISRESVFALLRTGKLRSVLIGKRNRRVTSAQLDAYLDSLETQPPDGAVERR